MYSSLQLAFKYLKYYVTSLNSKGHGMHSPFVFSFIQYVLNNKNNYKGPEEIEQLRKELKKNSDIIEVEDMGAGSRVISTKRRTVKQIATNVLKPKKYSRLLYRIVKYYQPQTIIELGTSLGITTAYLSKAAPSSKIITVEGSISVSEIAQANFKILRCNNIELFQGNFDSILNQVLIKLNTVDLAFIDGNHQYQPTINYFKQFLSKSDNDSILIFDDIHWSKEMEKAWEEIKINEEVRCTIDLFFIGLVFFRKEFKEKRHFTIRY